MKNFLACIQKRHIHVVATAVALSTVLVSPVRADDSKTDDDKKKFSIRESLEKAFDGSSVATRYRYQENNAGGVLFDQAQYQVDLKLQLALTPDGKLKVIGRVLNGPAFDTAFNNTGVGGNEKAKGAFDIGLRNLYFDYTVNNQLSLDGGALPSLPSGVKDGVFSMHSAGWVDGARANYKTLKSWASDVNVTVGRVDDFTETSITERGFGSPNFIQIHVRGNISKRLGYMVEGTDYKAINGDHDQLVRSTLDIAVNDVIGFIDSITLEELVQSGADQTQQGFALSMKKAIKDWTLSATYSDKGDEVAKKDKFHIPREDFYLGGQQASFMASKKLPKLNSSVFVRVGKDIDDGKFFSLKGCRAEVGFKYTFKKKTRKPPTS